MNSLISAINVGAATVTTMYSPIASTHNSDAIVLTYYDDHKLVHIKAAKVGDAGIKPNTFYMLNCIGQIVKVDENGMALEIVQ